MAGWHRNRKPLLLAWIITTAGILLLIAGISLGDSIVAKVIQLNGEISMDKVTVSVKNVSDNQELIVFSLSDMQELSDKLRIDAITFSAGTAAGTVLVTNNNAAVRARIIGTNSQYPKFSCLNLEYGSFFTGRAEADGDAAAVIDETMAWNLFRTGNAIGRKVQIYGTYFKITGVVKNSGSILQTLTDDGIPEVYIPAGKLLELDTTSRIAWFQVKTAEPVLPGHHEAAISNALQTIGKNPENYIITNFDKMGVLLAQIPEFARLIPGLAAIVMLAGLLIRKVKGIFIFIKAEYSEKDWRCVIRENIPRIGMDLLTVLALTAGIVSVFWAARFSPYIPPEYIPERLIDISFYTNLVKTAAENRLSGMGHILPEFELILNMGFTLSVIVTTIPVLLSFLLIGSGFRRFNGLDADMNKLALLCAIPAVASLAAAAAAALLMGLPVALRTKTILISWAFVFIINLKFTMERKVSVKCSKG